MKNRRTKLLIEPHFQTRLILRLGAWVLLSTVMTAFVTFGALTWADLKTAGDFFYVVQEAGTHPEIFTRTEIILPSLLISLAINISLTFIFALFYSQRLAGPIHRLITEMVKIERGDKVKPSFHLRDSDELQDVAFAFDAMLKRLDEKGALNTK
ncbi:MAG: hypothetical protein COB53_04995 [Elusimicrobia bacterium]|nr:MAG: hypothetical protein COB53_04995 [Elusimicrobiota bacterium]